MALEKIIKKTLLSLLLGASIAGGCNSSSNAFLVNHGRMIKALSGEPRTRMGAYPTTTIGIKLIDAESLGTHSYMSDFPEGNGIVYTKKAGHIDIFHVREASDLAAFLAAETFQHLSNNEEEFSFKLKEPSRYFVKLRYPENWKNLPEQERERTRYNLSLKLGQYLAFSAETWHEILTWFGYKSTGIFSEFPSAFSWEDSFSNLLGTHIGIRAIESSLDYNQAVTIAIKNELEKLETLPAKTSRQLTESLRGKWFSGNLICIVDVKKRSFDIGLSGFITPLIAPCPREKIQAGKMTEYPVPNSDISQYNFSLKLEIEPREWEKNRILGIISTDGKLKRINPDIHFPIILDYIKKDAVKIYGSNVDNPD